MEQISSKQFLKEVKNEVGSVYSLNQLFAMWQDLYKSSAKIDWDVLNLVEQLRNRYKVYILTDTIDVHDKYNKTRGIYDKFNKVFKSYKEKVSKVQGKQIFKNILTKIKVQPNECVYIDDVKEYAQTAEIIGMQGIVFHSLLRLKEELGRKKVL